MSPGRILLIRRLPGLQDYVRTWETMRAFTDTRDSTTGDELWLLEHPPVFTLGQAGQRIHLRDTGIIPVVQSDRGGQVTYHGPGQLIAYLLLDLRRRGDGVKGLVGLLELSIMDLLACYGIAGVVRPGAPGVYVQGAKIAALGLRVRRGCTYHGLALNVAMDLAPFQRINPCGHPGLVVTQIRDWNPDVAMESTALGLADSLARRLGMAPHVVG